MNNIRSAILVAVLAVANVCVSAEFPKTGTASWYGDECRGLPQANGKPFIPEALTVASWHHKLGTKLRVTTSEGKSVVVTVEDRGPAKRLVAKGRILDLSAGAFSQLADRKAGLVVITNVEVIP